MGLFDGINEAIHRLAQLADRMPSEATLKELIKLSPELRRLPSEETLHQLAAAVPYLQNMPSETTLKALMALAKKSETAGTMPTRQTLERLVAVLEKLERRLPDEAATRVIWAKLLAKLPEIERLIDSGDKLLAIADALKED